MYNLPEPRPMGRKERRSFRDAGIDPAFQNRKTDKEKLTAVELDEKITDFIIDEVYKIGEETQETPWSELTKLANATYGLTYGMVEDIKNSEASGTGTATDAQTTAEPAEVQN